MKSMRKILKNDLFHIFYILIFSQKKNTTSTLSAVQNSFKWYKSKENFFFKCCILNLRIRIQKFLEMHTVHNGGPQSK